MTTLPPGVSAAAFQSALRAFQSTVGADWVFSSPEDIELYRDAYSILWGEKEERVASAAVAPATVEQVQAVVRIANQYRIPLYAISTGRNLTYGGSAPNYSGSVVVDLKRMNRVLEVDDKRNFAIVEPGVSYFDLYRHIQDRGLKVWIDCPDPGWGSPVGNSLDHGIGYTYGVYRDHFGAHCGMEVVLANGEVIRTGMGAVPGARSWADYKYGYGPYVDGLFAQGNFGIVTKMGFWLMPQPESYLVGTVLVPEYGELAKLVEHVNYLEDSGLIAEPAYFSPAAGSFLAPPDPPLAAMLAKGWPTAAELNAYARAKNAACWGVSLPMMGPPATIQGTWSYIKQRLGASLSGAVFQDGGVLKLPLTAEQEASFARRVTIGIPNMEIFSMVTRSPFNEADPPAGHADFTCVIARTGEAIHEAQRMLYEAHVQMGAPPQGGPFNVPVCWHQRTFIMAAVVWTYRDPERNRKSRALFSHLLQSATKHGFAEYRTAPAFQDELAAQYSFGDHALRRFTESLKDAADPNGILSPGRAGIWPRHLRPPRHGENS
jgi:4-cresol dehydrogenase (hydroxylating)